MQNAECRMQNWGDGGRVIRAVNNRPYNGNFDRLYLQNGHNYGMLDTKECEFYAF